MVDTPDNKWSYGMSREPDPVSGDPSWPPPASAFEQDGSSQPRQEGGQFTSPSLGAYDGMTSVTDQQLAASTEDEDQYFDQYGYGDDYGDGSFDGDDPLDPDELDAGSDARRNAIEWAVVLVGAVLLALILRALLLQAFWIPSPSMESTLLVRDRVLVNKVSYRLHDINRGDVVVFRRTDAEIASNPELPRDVIKRVIALEGESIKIEENTVFIDDVPLRESYLDPGVINDDFPAEVVPEGHVFVMGDNRELSLDSRFATGPIAHDRVVGRAFFLFWPLDRIGSL